MQKLRKLRFEGERVFPEWESEPDSHGPAAGPTDIKAEGQPWSLLRELLTTDTIHWLHGFVAFASWRTAQQKLAYPRLFRVVASKVRSTLTDTLGINGVHARYDRQHGCCTLQNPESILATCNIRRSKQFAADAHDAFLQDDPRRGWQLVRSAHQEWRHAPQLLRALSLAPSALPARLQSDLITHLVKGLTQYKRDLIEAFIKVTLLQWRGSQGFERSPLEQGVPVPVSQYLHEWNASLHRTAYVLTLLEGHGPRSRDVSSTAVDEFIALANKYIEADEAAHEDSHRDSQVERDVQQQELEQLFDEMQHCHLVDGAVERAIQYFHDTTDGRIDDTDVSAARTPALYAMLEEMRVSSVPPISIARQCDRYLHLAVGDRRKRSGHPEYPLPELPADYRMIERTFLTRLTAFERPDVLTHTIHKVFKTLPDAPKEWNPADETRPSDSRSYYATAVPSEQAAEAVCDDARKAHAWLRVLETPVRNRSVYQEPKLVRIGTHDPKRRALAGAPAASIDSREFVKTRGGPLWQDRLLQFAAAQGEPVAIHDILTEFRKAAPDMESAVPRILVTAEPGSGKTSMLENLAYRASSGDLQVGGRPNIPALVRLHLWEKSDQSPNLVTYLTKTHKDLACPPDREQWRQWLHGGDVLLLFDGFNEITDNALLCDELHRTLDRFDQCPAILTCRPTSLGACRSSCPGFAEFTLTPLTPAQRAAYIEALPGLDVSAQDSLADRLAHSPATESLTRNPLLLSILCLVSSHANKDVQPATRSTLYETAIENLLEPRERSPGHPFTRSAAQRVHRRRRVIELASLRVLLHDGQGTGSAFQARRFLEAMASPHPRGSQNVASLDIAQETLDDLVDAGLVTCSSDHICTFLHPILHESMAAAAIAHCVDESSAGWDAHIECYGVIWTPRTLVTAKSWDPRWEEIIILLAGKLQDPRCLLKILTEADAHGRKDDHFKHRLAVAARCLPEISRDILPRDVVEKIEAGVSSCLLHHALYDTVSAVEHLKPAIADVLSARPEHNSEIPQEWLPACLDKLNTHANQRTLRLLRAVRNASDMPEILDACQGELQDADTDALVDALDFVGDIGRDAATPDVLAWLRKLLVHDEEEIQDKAAETIGRLGRAAATQENLDGLASLLRHDDILVLCATMQALADLGPDAASPGIRNSLNSLLEHREMAARTYAAFAIGEIGADVVGDKTLGHLANMLTCEDPQDREIALTTLLRLGPEASAPEICHALLDIVSDAALGANERMLAERTLMRFGGTRMAPELMEQLLAMQTSNDTETRGWATRAISHLYCQNPTEENLQHLAELLNREDGAVQAGALSALAEYKDDVSPPGIQERLVELLEQQETCSKAACVIEARHRMTWPANLIERLGRLLDRDNAEMQRIAVRIISTLGAKAVTQSNLTRLARLLRHDDSGVQLDAIRAIYHGADKAAKRDARTQLTRLLVHEDNAVRQAAAKVANNRDPEAASADVLARLVDGLDDDSNIPGALSVIEHLGNADWTAVQITRIARLLDCEDSAVPEDTARFLGALGSNAATSVTIDSLVRLLNHKWNSTRRTAARTLQVFQNTHRLFKDDHGIWTAIPIDMLSSLSESHKAAD